MVSVVFDCNIYDQFAVDEEARTRAREMVGAGELCVLVPESLRRELNNGPFKGVPDWFDTNETSDSVFVIGHSGLGTARLGRGEVYQDHKGDSKKVSDAVLADTAAADADYFVSEDNRARKRLKRKIDPARSLTFSEFRERVLGLAHRHGPA